MHLLRLIVLFASFALVGCVTNENAKALKETDGLPLTPGKTYLAMAIYPGWWDSALTYCAVSEVERTYEAVLGSSATTICGSGDFFLISSKINSMGALGVPVLDTETYAFQDPEGLTIPGREETLNFLYFVFEAKPGRYVPLLAYSARAQTILSGTLAVADLEAGKVNYLGHYLAPRGQGGLKQITHIPKKAREAINRQAGENLDNLFVDKSAEMVKVTCNKESRGIPLLTTHKAFVCSQSAPMPIPKKDQEAS